jgi:hypothetical protein
VSHVTCSQRRGTGWPGCKRSVAAACCGSPCAHRHALRPATINSTPASGGRSCAYQHSRSSAWIASYRNATLCSMGDVGNTHTSLILGSNTWTMALPACMPPTGSTTVHAHAHRLGELSYALCRSLVRVVWLVIHPQRSCGGFCCIASLLYKAGCSPCLQELCRRRLVRSRACAADYLPPPPPLPPPLSPSPRPCVLHWYSRGTQHTCS